MYNLDDLLEQIVEKKKQLHELEETSPEAALALKREGEYQDLLQELKDRVGRPTPVPVPYPVYPFYSAHWVSWPQYTQPLISSGHTTVTLNATAGNTI